MLFQHFTVGSLVCPGPIMIRSCPFSDTNPNLFAYFRSTGTISLSILLEEKHYGYLSDVKFLDKMTGGVADLFDLIIIELVLVNLRNLNVDRDLTVLLACETISSMVFSHAYLGESLVGPQPV